LQIISFTIFSYSLKFVDGFGLLLNFDFTESLTVKIGVDLSVVRFAPHQNVKIFSINLFASVIAIWLIGLKKKLFQEIETLKLSNDFTS
jgi:hypothetical protein